ncbi:hypothetical protein [Arthrobacter globiformis]|uniref:Uncharacterized protein n=1 Tax=Arthrobacter globiformis TaxID=1665 RepID=A0A328HIE6_ARTGO|nr:hypothetical protein [Arthrobacter globiformis]RAM38302.1 hypothetical protein DBZ45_04620 [Arthrobacter globiformis]
MAIVLVSIAVAGIVVSFFLSSNAAATLLTGAVGVVNILQGEPEYKKERPRQIILFITYGVVLALSVGLGLAVLDAGNSSLFANDETALMARTFGIPAAAAVVSAISWLVKLKMDPAK